MYKLKTTTEIQINRMWVRSVGTNSNRYRK